VPAALSGENFTWQASGASFAVRRRANRRYHLRMALPDRKRRAQAGEMPDAARAGADEGVLASRLSSGAWVVLIASLVFAGVDLVMSPEVAGLLMIVKAVQCAVLLVLIVGIPRAQDDESRARLGAIVLSAVYVTTTISGILRDEVAASMFLVFVTTIATAAFVPWGGRVQLLTAIVAGMTLVFGRTVVPLPIGRDVVYRWLAMAIALGGSVWIAREQETQRRVRRAAERQLATASQVSSALARAGEELIRDASGPAILDLLCRLVAELLHCDRASLILQDPAGSAFSVHSGYGHESAEWDFIRGVSVSASSVKHLLDALNEHGAVQTVTGDIAGPMLREMLSRGGIAVSLYVPLRQASEIMGIVSAHRSDPQRKFSRAEQRIAIGVAQLASMALQNARLLDELREANRLKSDFVSTMSHELRTPVSVILGYTEMIAEGPDRSDRAAILQRIRRSGLELLELIEETLDLGRLEAGQDPPRFEDVAVPEMFAELVAEFRAMTSLEDVAIRWQGPDQLVIRSDPRKLRMILKNLLGNALKFTSHGEVVLECATHDGTVLFIVRDTGVGIAAQHLPIIFDMFRQADSSDARRYPGAGLGLYIVQRLVRQLGGDIHVSSELGHGTAFTFALPSGVAAAQLAPARESARASA
jgi:signal transduction histidine kinase